MIEKLSQIFFLRNQYNSDTTPFGPEISTDAAHELLEKIGQITPTNNICYGDKIDIVINTVYQVSKHDKTYQSIMDVYIDKPKCLHCNNTKRQTTNMTPAQCFQTCLRNMQNGKCCNSFMSETFGQTLFPDKYANIYEQIIKVK